MPLGKIIDLWGCAMVIAGKSVQITLEGIASVVALLLTMAGTLVGSYIYIDGRYAHADDLDTKIKQVLLPQAKLIADQTRSQTRLSVDGLRKQLLEDKVFELTLVPPDKRSDAQRALLDRYRTQVQEISARMNTAAGAAN